MLLYNILHEYHQNSKLYYTNSRYYTVFIILQTFSDNNIKNVINILKKD